MRTFLCGVFLFLASAAGAAPASENVARAKDLNERAKKEPDPQRALLLRQEACAAWESAYAASLSPELLLETSACKLERGEKEGAERDLRLFLQEAPPKHPARPVAEQAITELVAQRQQEALTLPAPVIEIQSPLPVEDSPRQSRRRGLLLGGVGGVLVLGGVGAFFLLRDDGINQQGTFTQRPK